MCVLGAVTPATVPPPAEDNANATKLIRPTQSPRPGEKTSYLWHYRSLAESTNYLVKRLSQRPLKTSESCETLVVKFGSQFVEELLVAMQLRYSLRNKFCGKCNTVEREQQA